MSEQRIKDLAAELYDSAFAALDAEPGISGHDAGRIATAAEQAFLAACREEGRYCEFCPTHGECGVCDKPF